MFSNTELKIDSWKHGSFILEINHHYWETPQMSFLRHPLHSKQINSHTKVHNLLNAVCQFDNGMNRQCDITDSLHALGCKFSKGLNTRRGCVGFQRYCCVSVFQLNSNDTFYQCCPRNVQYWPFMNKYCNDFGSGCHRNILLVQSREFQYWPIRNKACRDFGRRCHRNYWY